MVTVLTKIRFALSVMPCMLFTSCDNSSADDTAPSPAVSTLQTGMDVFSTPAYNQGAKMQDNTIGNSFACATCHDIGLTSSDDYRRAGHSLASASIRPSFKNGQLTELIDAVNSCRDDWMNAAKYTETDPHWLLLEAYLKEQTEEDSAPALSFEIKEAPTNFDISGGDEARGRALFNTSCALCHGQDGEGSQQGPAIAGTNLSADAIAAKVRTSGPEDSEVYEGVNNGIMPFWSADKLSDSELADLIVYLEASEATEGANTGESSDSSIDLSVSNAQTNCGSTSAKIGQTLSFSTLSHRVAGTATIVDDCTIKLEPFTFDGGGIDVRIYAANGLGRDAFNAGTSLTKDFLGTSFVDGTATFRLPVGVSLDDFTSLSVWCVAAGISFGEGTFSN